MPCFNSQSFIRHAIESVVKQTYSNWELIVVDDSSTDGTPDTVRSYISIDHRIKLHLLPENSGNPSIPRNHGIAKSAGSYLAFLDSDDIWLPDKLKRQQSFMKENDCHFSFSSYSMINEQGEPKGKPIKVPHKIDYSGILKNTIVACSTVMIDRSHFGELYFPNVRHEDTAAWLGILRGGATAFGLNETLVLYRKHSQSVSRSKLKTVLWTWNIYRKTENLNLLRSVYCFSFYVINAIKKHYFL
jgi:teichuronic acid biosynthesis glycosyltransferase TuaG